MTLVPELELYKNRSRVLLIFAPSLKYEAYLEQKRFLAQAKNGLGERDLVVLELLESEHTKALRDDFVVSSDTFAVILIGKDGSEKERFLEPIEPAQLFSLIDQMPMRRREMRERE